MTTDKTLPPSDARSHPTWIITQEPRETPRRKGPFHSNQMVEDFLREAYRLYPEIICIVINDPLDNGWYPEHGYEWLDVKGDRRRRHPRKDRPPAPPPQANVEGEPDFLEIAKLAGFHGITYPTNAAMQAFMARYRALAATSEGSDNA